MREVVRPGFKGIRRRLRSVQGICGARTSLGTLWCRKGIRKIPHTFSHGMNSERFIRMTAARPWQQEGEEGEDAWYTCGTARRCHPHQRTAGAAFCKQRVGVSPSGQALSKQGFRRRKVLRVDLKGK